MKLKDMPSHLSTLASELSNCECEDDAWHRLEAAMYSIEDAAQALRVYLSERRPRQTGDSEDHERRVIPDEDGGL